MAQEDVIYSDEEKTHMSDETVDRNERVKAAMRQTGTAPPLNTGPGQTPGGAKLKNTRSRPTGHVEVGTGKKS